MSRIEDLLHLISTAVYGIDMRAAIHDSIEECYDNVSDAKTIADSLLSTASNLVGDVTTAVQNAQAAAQSVENVGILANQAVTLATTAANNAQSVADSVGDAVINANLAAQKANDAGDFAQSIANLLDGASEAANIAAANAQTQADLAEIAVNQATTAALNAQSKANLAEEKAILADGKAGLVDEAIYNANEAAINAQEMADLAETKALLADEKAQLIINATSEATTAALNAQQKADLADEKANLADQMASLANSAASSANTAAARAEGAAVGTEDIINAATQATSNANTATQNANTATSSATTAAQNANTNANEATLAATLATNAANLANLSASNAETASNNMNNVKNDCLVATNEANGAVANYISLSENLPSTIINLWGTLGLAKVDDDEWSYPLNLNQHINADVIQLWHYGRTSGVFSGEDELVVTPNGATSISISPGVAWLSYSRFGGIVYGNLKPKLLSLDPSHATLNRIDRIVIRYNVGLNEVKAVVKKGTPSATPAPPSIQRDALIYEIALADVSIEASLTALEHAHISDLRLDETVCGLVSDGVTRIPSQALENQFTSWMQEEKNKVHEWFQSVRGLLNDDPAVNLSNQMETVFQEISNLTTELSSKVDKTDVRNDLIAEEPGEALDAFQGKVLYDAIVAHMNDKDNSHKVTSLQAGALPLTGGTVTGDIYLDCLNGWRGYRFSNASSLKWSCTLRATPSTGAETYVIQLYDSTNARSIWAYLTDGNFRINRPLDLSTPLSLANGGTNATTAAAARTSLGLANTLAGRRTIGLGVSLWSGTAAEGTVITVPNIADYGLLIVRVGTIASSQFLAIHSGGLIRGGGSQKTSTTANYHNNYGIEMSVSGTNVTINYCKYIQINPSATPSAQTTSDVRAIVGVY